MKDGRNSLVLCPNEVNSMVETYLKEHFFKEDMHNFEIESVITNNNDVMTIMFKGVADER